MRAGTHRRFAGDSGGRGRRPVRHFRLLRRMQRPADEIGISAVRGGTIVGEHEIIFAGHDEIMEIKHTALSREIFAHYGLDADGIVKAALEFLK